MELKITPEILAQRQRMPLDLKIDFTLARIRHWYEQYCGRVYVAFSGGKDSTVLLDLVRTRYPEVPAVFVDTGLEYPEIRAFVKTIPNVTWLRPAQNFRAVLDHHGYPVVSKVVARAVYRIRSAGSSERSKHKALYGDERGHYGRLPLRWRFLLEAPFKISDRCCEVMKIRPIMKYHAETGRAGVVGTMAADSNSRRKQYLRHGCYLDHLRCPRSTPLAFWTEGDIWEYLRERSVPYSSIYDSGVHHTGCMFCLFGLHLEESPNRFELMAQTHPGQYAYCMEQCGIRGVLDYLSQPGACGPPTDPALRPSLARDRPLLALASSSPAAP
jgi:3'-phosphoadenosine 5'-phosphosulfate sulfotransferase (PAPS reductase)/FAD synthetase